MERPQATRTPGVSMFFPAYNDGGTIASLVIRAVQTASKLTPDFEVIVVNDGSSDETRDVADELASPPGVSLVEPRATRRHEQRAARSRRRP